MKSKTKIGILFGLFASFAAANFASAALVVCGRKDTPNCDLGTLLEQVFAVVNYLIGAATLLAIAYVLYGGVMLVLSRGSSEGLKNSKTIIFNAVQGLIIVLLAYVIVSTAIAALTGGKTMDEILKFLPNR